MKLIFFILILFIATLSYAHKFTSVTTKDGEITGVVSKGIRIFRGIPYAKPPLGKLRFKSPKPFGSHATIKAVKYAPDCLSALTAWGDYSNNTSEDCLYLNIFAPLQSKRYEAKYPVMVLIPDTLYSYGGSSGDFYRKIVDKNRNVILVTFNFRLNSFGFFANEYLRKESRHHSTGNYGLQDQQLCLKWINKNIAAFGGDSKEVTIFGGSSTSSNVALHLVIPSSKGLFSKAIIQTGAPSKFNYNTYKDSKTMSDIVLEKIGCSGRSPKKQIKCARKVSAKVLQQASFALSVPGWKPTIDTTFFPDIPNVLVSEGKFNKVPVIIGSLQNATNDVVRIAGVTPKLKVAEFMKLTKDLFGKSLYGLFELYYDFDILKSSPTGPFNLFNQIYNDYVVRCPTRLFARQLSANNVPVYSYLHSFVPKADKNCSCGASIFSDFGYFFECPSSLTKEEEFFFTNLYQIYWNCFVTSGNPNCDILTVWPKFTTKRELALEINNPVTIFSELDNLRCDMWELVFKTPELYNSILKSIPTFDFARIESQPVILEHPFKNH